MGGVVSGECGARDRDCMVKARAESLISGAGAGAQYWAHDSLPSKGELPMAGWIVQDRNILNLPVDKAWAMEPITVPVVIGSTAQAEANEVNFQFSIWNDTDQVEAIVEGGLGSFQGELPVQALARYKEKDNWDKYISMVSHIRTVCPLENLVRTMRENYTFPYVSFYLATESRMGEDGLETGNVSDPGMDIGAILGLLESGNQRFQENLQRKFLSFVRGFTKTLSPGISLFGETTTKTKNLEQCDFWRKTEDSIVPNFGKRF